MSYSNCDQVFDLFDFDHRTQRRTGTPHRYGRVDRSRAALARDLDFKPLYSSSFCPCDLDLRSIVLSETKVGSRLLQATTGCNSLSPAHPPD